MAVNDLANTDTVAGEVDDARLDQGPAKTGTDIAAPAVKDSKGPDRKQADTLMRWSDITQTLNIIDELEDDEVGEIGQRCTREYNIDAESRKDWLTKSKTAMDLAMQVAKSKSFPWPNASNIIYPLMTEAAIEFGARAYPAIVAGRNVVKGVVIGPDNGTPQMAPDGTPAVAVDPKTGGPMMGPDGKPQIMWAVPPGEKRRRAERIGEHMSWQLLEEQAEWEEETDKLVHILPIVGCCFRKTYFDPQIGCNASVLALAENVVINYLSKSTERTPRISEDFKLYPVEIEESERADVFTKNEYGMAQGGGADTDAPHDFIEMHRWLDLDGDGYPEPYIVTLHKTTSKVARIIARYDADGVFFSKQDHRVRKIEPVHYYTKYDFLPNVEGGIYGLGFGQLLGPINEGINTSINQLIDAGTRQNMGGGFIGKGLSMHGGSVKHKMGEYKHVNVPGAAIRDAIVHLEVPQPSLVLFQLLGKLEDAGARVASIKDILSGELAAQTMSPTTLLGIVEQGLKVFTAIYKRVHRAAKHDYDKLARLNRIYLDEQSGYRVGNEWKTIARADYEKGCGVAPVSDPSMVTDMQRLAKAGFLQGYQNDPMCDGIEIRRRIFDAAGQENQEALFAKQQGPSIDQVKAAAAFEAEVIRARAAAIKDLSAAIKNLADADKTVGETALAFVGQQFEILKDQLDRLDAKSAAQAGNGGAAGAGGAGDQGTGLQLMAPPSGDQGGAGSVSPGLSGGA